MTSLKTKISNHVASLRSSQKSTWANMYAQDHVAILSNVLPKDIEEGFVNEARALIKESSERRELIIKESGNTPRAYDSVGRDDIRDKGEYIPAIFDSDEFCALLSEISGQELHRVPYTPEEFIINSQNKPNDTHGWHWDDYAFALIWCIDEPDRLHLAPLRHEWLQKPSQVFHHPCSHSLFARGAGARLARSHERTRPRRAVDRSRGQQQYRVEEPPALGTCQSSGHEPFRPFARYPEAGNANEPWRAEEVRYALSPDRRNHQFQFPALHVARRFCMIVSAGTALSVPKIIQTHGP